MAITKKYLVLIMHPFTTYCKGTTKRKWKMCRQKSHFKMLSVCLKLKWREMNAQIFDQSSVEESVEESDQISRLISKLVDWCAPGGVRVVEWGARGVHTYSWKKTSRLIPWSVNLTVGDRELVFSGMRNQSTDVDISRQKHVCLWWIKPVDW